MRLQPIADIKARGHLARMVKNNSERMGKLLKQNRLQKRAAVLIERWASHDVSVSPIAHDRYWLLLDKLRGGHSWPLQWTSDILGEVRAFSVGSDILTILGWNVDEEPALLVSTEKLISQVSSLGHIYPDGFVLVSDVARKALLVDFDDDKGTHVNTIDLPTPAV